MDSAGNITTISPHRFALYEPSPADPAPFSYYSKNRFTGKEINVDMSGAIRDLEAVTGKTYVHIADLPESERVGYEQWREEQISRLTQEAMERAVAENPWIEIELAEAIEETPEMELVWVTKPVTRFRANLETATVEPYQTEISVTEERPTGRTIKRFKPGCWLNEETGKVYRGRTIEDLQPEDVPPVSDIEPPQWLRDRMR